MYQGQACGCGGCSQSVIKPETTAVEGIRTRVDRELDSPRSGIDAEAFRDIFARHSLRLYREHEEWAGQRGGLSSSYTRRL